MFPLPFPQRYTHKVLHLAVREFGMAAVLLVYQGHLSPSRNLSNPPKKNFSRGWEMVWLDYMELHDDLVTISHQFPHSSFPRKHGVPFVLYQSARLLLCLVAVNLNSLARGCGVGGDRTAVVLLPSPRMICTAVVSSCGMKVYGDCLAKQTMNHNTRSPFPQKDTY